MYSNFFTIALRNIRNRKFFAGINLLGMTAGITACLLIALYVLDELSYDRFHANADRIYQVGLHSTFGARETRSASICPPLADAMMAEIPEVESTLRMTRWGKPVFQYEEKAFTEDKVYIVESNFFDFFSFELLSGNGNTALKEPKSVVITETVASRYFGEEDPLGKVLLMGEGDQQEAYTVTGVAADCPRNSHFRFDVLIAATGPDNYFEVQEWLNSGVYTYFLLRENASAIEVEKKLEGIVTKYVAPKLKQFLDNSTDEFSVVEGAYRYYPTKITDIHLRSTSSVDIEPGGSQLYVYVMAGIGIFILGIACINFMNLSTAQSASRAREVGLRKTLGALRYQMVGQFLAESIMYSLVAVVLAIVLCYYLLPAFNTLAGKELSMISLLDIRFDLWVGLIVVVAGVLAGSYPAFYLTSFNVAEVLKGKVRSGSRSKTTRRALVVFQFAISIFLIIFTSVVYTQIDFMQHLNLGMDKDNVLVIGAGQRLGNNGEAFRHALLQQSGISNASFVINRFPEVYNPSVMRSTESAGDHFVAIYYTDFDFPAVMKVGMKEGRFFSKEFPSDSSAVVINEAAAREFGIRKLEDQEVFYSPNAYKYLPYRVVGIIRDFNVGSYREKVRPIAIFSFPFAAGNLMVRYEGNPRSVVEKSSELWKKYAGHQPFDYSFLDTNYDALFRSENQMGQLLTLFSGLAIFIACLGLFALAAFVAEQRTKEIGIRKVLGASVIGISWMLTSEFVVLVLVAFVPAALVGWWISNQWLSGFAYRVEVSGYVLVGAGVLGIAIAWITVGFQSGKAARANPVETLRHE